MNPMSDAEHEAMEMTANLWNHLVQKVVTDGPSRLQDLEEICALIHGIQARVMGQAAARAYPDKYRLLGGPPPRPKES